MTNDSAASAVRSSLLSRLPSQQSAGVAAGHRPSASLERAGKGALSIVPGSTRQAVVESLQCLVCLDVVQLPVNLTCFPGCPGTHARANNTCLRGALCQHCANDALQLDRPPAQRFPEDGGRVRCMICRDTSVDAKLLTPIRSYIVNHSLMDVMDAVDVGAACRKCELDFPSQAVLQAHYQKQCPYAVVQCRFKGCPQVGVRSLLEAHQDSCTVGRAVCQQCQERLDKDELVYHMVALCRMRVVVCVLCQHRARLPDMLLHLRLHQAQLQLQMLQKGSPAVGHNKGALARGATTTAAHQRPSLGNMTEASNAAVPVQLPQPVQQRPPHAVGTMSQAVAVTLRSGAVQPSRGSSGPSALGSCPSVRASPALPQAPAAAQQLHAGPSVGQASAAVASAMAALPVASAGHSSSLASPATSQPQQPPGTVHSAAGDGGNTHQDAVLPDADPQDFGSELDAYLAAAALDRTSSSQTETGPVAAGHMGPSGRSSNSSGSASYTGQSSIRPAMSLGVPQDASTAAPRAPGTAGATAVNIGRFNSEAMTLLPGSMLPANQHQMLFEMLQRLRRRQQQQEEQQVQVQQQQGQAQGLPAADGEDRQQQQQQPAWQQLVNLTSQQASLQQAAERQPGGCSGHASAQDNSSMGDTAAHIGGRRSGEQGAALPGHAGSGLAADVQHQRHPDSQVEPHEPLHQRPAASAPSLAATAEQVPALPGTASADFASPSAPTPRQSDPGSQGVPLLFTVGPALFRRRTSDLTSCRLSDSDAMAPSYLGSTSEDPASSNGLVLGTSRGLRLSGDAYGSQDAGGVRGSSQPRQPREWARDCILGSYMEAMAFGPGQVVLATRAALERSAEGSSSEGTAPRPQGTTASGMHPQPPGHEACEADGLGASWATATAEARLAAATAALLGVQGPEDGQVGGTPGTSSDCRHSRRVASLQHQQLSMLHNNGSGGGSGDGALQHLHLPWVSVGNSPCHPGTPHRRRGRSLELHCRRRRLSDSEAVEANRQELAAASQAVAAMLLSSTVNRQSPLHQGGSTPR